ncbi:hypothetical protein LK533_06370 [Sphingomonas sp. PL-96]|uniref:hypothetical protein n=1 Tax=Sphingomonas sp. PL-96 TaxID=2887201 RepID=UPI001E28A7A0|nr:hypothetical protein [Sphingomonas sp. PL-96]MCC2976297.1 hypothetical protein [Sphingomonas sp. PL-96]
MQAVGNAAPMVATVEMERVWDRTAAFIRGHAVALFALGGLALFAPTVALAIAEAAVDGADGATRGLLSVVQIAGSLLMLWAELAVVALAILPGALGPAMRQAGLRLAVVIGFALLLTLALLLLGVPVIGILAGYGFDFTAAAVGEEVMPSAAAAAWIALYGLVLLPLLLWVGARLSLLAPVVLAERRGLRAFARSFALTRGLAARIIGVLLLYGVVRLVLTSAVRFAAGTVFAIAFGSDDGLGIASILTRVSTGLVETALAVLLWAFTGKLYLEACQRQDGTAAHR